MRRLYKPFFIAFGLIYILTGLALAFTREFFNFFLTPPPLPGPAIIIAFLCVFAGLALFGIAFVESVRSRRFIIKLVIAGYVFEAAAHLTNSFLGHAPAYAGPVATVIIALIIILLITIDRDLKIDREFDLPNPN
ncbi:MAG: hypothetical protein DRP71_04350 [Verrucomicrobia bacterium]|nr:MAG: hypothetical protein DRP71_04350 [Verrucomicrobiota bacterium]